MKAGREHRVPLSDRALAVLDEARQLSDAGGTCQCDPSVTIPSHGPSGTPVAKPGSSCS